MVWRHSGQMGWVQGRIRGLGSVDQQTRQVRGFSWISVVLAATWFAVPSECCEEVVSRKVVKLGRCRSLKGLPGSLVQTK